MTEAGVGCSAPEQMQGGYRAIEPILLTTVRLQTFQGQRPLTNATGFFSSVTSSCF